MGSIRSTSSPVVPVGQIVIDHVPKSVKDWAIDWFGTADKAVLIMGSLLTLLVIGTIVGQLAVQGNRAAAYATTAVVGLIGMVAVLSRPAPSFAKLMPALVGTLVSIGVIWWLAPREEAAVETGDETAAVAAGIERRRLLQSSGLVAAGALVAGLFGRSLQRRFEVADERADLALPEPVARGVQTTPDHDFGIEGISPFVTPVDEFYRIDTAITVPQIPKDSWRLKIRGMVDTEVELTFDDLLAMDQIETIVTLSCVSNEIGGNLVGNGMWQGVRISDVLDLAGVQPGADQLVSRSIDGWNCGTPMSAVTDGRDSILAVAQNGEPLRADHGYPVRMVVPGLYGYVSATKWVTELELTTWDAFDGYWVPRGWSKEGPVKTMARIDRPRRGRSWPAGTLDVGGVAWAIHRGISAVEIRIDNGEWLGCELAGVPSDDTWRQWRYTWTEATPGNHEIEARAYDKSGEPQPVGPASVAPNGAEGYHRVSFRVDESDA